MSCSLAANRELDRHVAVQQALAQSLDEQVDDLQQLRLAQLREDDGLVDAVEELGLEVLLQLLDDLAAHPVVAGGGVGAELKPTGCP